MITQSDVDAAVDYVRLKSPYYFKFLDTFKFKIRYKDDLTIVRTGTRFEDSFCMPDDDKNMLHYIIYHMCNNLQDKLWEQIRPLMVDTDLHLLNCNMETMNVKVIPFQTDNDAIYVPPKVYHKLVADVNEHNELIIVNKDDLKFRYGIDVAKLEE